MAVFEDLDESEKYLLAILTEETGVDPAEFLWTDERSDDGLFRCYDYQVPWYRDDAKFSIDQAARSVGKSVSIQLRSFAFPFSNPGQEMLLTAPELIHLDPVTRYVEERLLGIRLSREMLASDGKTNGINKRPFQVKFRNGARIVGRIPQKDGRGIKGCVAEGTMVLTRRGQVPVEDVVPGDEVLTHEGNWKTVRANYSYAEPYAVEVSGGGHRGLVMSESHRMWARRNRNPQRTRNLQDPTWVIPYHEEELDRYYLASPYEFPSEPIPEHPGDDLGTLLWVAGRYAADGYLMWQTKPSGTRTSARMMVVVKGAEVDEVVARCEKAGLTAAVRGHSQDGVFQVEVCNTDLARWLLDQFGQHADSKEMPVWLLGADEHLKRAWLDGYTSGDGHRDKRGRWHIGTASKSLAVSVRLLVQSLGYSATFTWVDPQVTHIRGVELEDTPKRAYRVIWSDKGIGLFDNGHVWQKVRAATKTDVARVYDLNVADDHSYIADGLVSHNQHPLVLEMDEGQDYPEPGWIELTETLKYGDENSRWRVHGVTRGVRDYFYKLTQQGSGWKVHRITAMHRGDWSAEERNAKAELYGGRHSPDYRRNILGEHGDAQSPLFVLTRLMACFLSDTPVQTEGGLLPIGDVTPGTVVKNAAGTGTVTKVQESHRDALIRVTLDDGEQFVCTPEHPWFTTGGWRHADTLAVGDALVGHDEAVRLVRGADSLCEVCQVLRESLRWELAGVNETEEAASDTRPEAPGAAGCRPGCVAGVARVARLEVLQQGDPEFDRLSREHGDGCGQVKVVDLTVSGHPSFLVGRRGLLVHNCVDSVKESPYNTGEYHYVRLADEQVRDSGQDIVDLLDLPEQHVADYARFWFGMDVGMTNHPTEILGFAETGKDLRAARSGQTDRLKLVCRIHLERISAPDQKKVMDALDLHYRPQGFGMDKTGLGLPIYQDVMAAENRHLRSVLRGYNFSSKIVVGYEDVPENTSADELERFSIEANVLEYSSDTLRLLVDEGKLWLPWDVELLREFQGQTYSTKRSTQSPYGKKMFSAGSFHALDAARMAALAYQQQYIEAMRVVESSEPVLDTWVEW